MGVEMQDLSPPKRGGVMHRNASLASDSSSLSISNINSKNLLLQLNVLSWSWSLFIQLYFPYILFHLLSKISFKKELGGMILKENKVEVLALPDFKIYYKAIIINR